MTAGGGLPAAPAASPAGPPDGSGAASSLASLVGRIAAGEQGALAQLYDGTAATLFGFARLIVRDQQDAEEVVCDVYMQVWRAPRRYDPARGSVLAWLLGICRARAIDRCRRKRARLPGEPARGESTCAGEAAQGEPCELLQRLEQGSVIRSALERLPPVRRQLLSLAYQHGLSHPEIATRTNLPVGTVKSHIRRALESLRAQLAPGGADGTRPAGQQPPWPLRG